MVAFLQLLGTLVANLFKSRRRLEVENLFLRHQLNIALRGALHEFQVRVARAGAGATLTSDHSRPQVNIHCTHVTS